MLSQGSHSLSVWDGNCRIDTVVVVSKANPVSIDPPIPEVMYLSGDTALHFTLQPSVSLTDPQWFFQNMVISESLALDWLPTSDGVLTFRSTYYPDCIFTDSIQIIKLEEVEYSLPNAFSPNGDGQNDVFTIPISETIIGVSQFQVFNRYGGLVYNNPKQGNGAETHIEWNGTINGREAAPGVYVVKAQLELANGDTELMIWPVQLIR